MREEEPGNLEWFSRAWLDTLRNLSAKGDYSEGLRLHEELAVHLSDAAVTGRINRGIAELLRDMHATIARGDDVSAALSLRKPPHAPRAAFSLKMKIYHFIEDLLPEHTDLSLSKKYVMASKKFGLSEPRVKAIYLEVRKAYREAKSNRD
ncbi:MAG: hypothetical protein ACTHNE_19900 [Dyella sp.]|uniref:hypothetical protein n=1 Tax=Dyella sp. TaxID=1869338 RepID=UPI003F80F06D